MEEIVTTNTGINSDWANRPSAWYYSLDEFKQFINGLEDNDAIIWNMLNDLKFKEITNVPKEEKTKMRKGLL